MRRRYDWAAIQAFYDEGHTIRDCQTERGEPLRVTLHHINGDPYDNRLENLSFLCPNCHTARPRTSADGNGHVRPRPAAEEAA